MGSFSVEGAPEREMRYKFQRGHVRFQLWCLQSIFDEKIFTKLPHHLWKLTHKTFWMIGCFVSWKLLGKHKWEKDEYWEGVGVTGKDGRYGI